MNGWLRGLLILGLIHTIFLPLAEVRAERPSDEELREIQNLCRSFLANPLVPAWVPVSDIPGLLILESEVHEGRSDFKSLLQSPRRTFERHELESISKYAAYIQRTGESVLLATSYEKHSIPGFDGVVFSPEGRIVANISLKTVANGKCPYERAIEGIERAELFSNLEDWFIAFGLVRADEDKDLHLIPSAQGTHRERLFSWMSQPVRLFGVNSRNSGHRLTRVVVHIQNDAALPTEHEQEKIRRRMKRTNGLIHSVVFMKKQKVIEVQVRE